MTGRGENELNLSAMSLTQIMSTEDRNDIP